MRILFIGTVLFSKNILDEIIKSKNKIVGVTGKKNAMKIYKSEIKKFPFPRSLQAIDALAKLRGSQIGKNAAECFEILREIN